MQSLGQFPVPFLRRIVARFRAWKSQRQARATFITPLYLHMPTYSAAIHRDVTPNGVRVYSLCCGCGAQLQASATLCEECAQKRSRQARPY